MSTLDEPRDAVLAAEDLRDRVQLPCRAPASGGGRVRRRLPLSEATRAALNDGEAGGQVSQAMGEPLVVRRYVVLEQRLEARGREARHVACDRPKIGLGDADEDPCERLG